MEQAVVTGAFTLGAVVLTFLGTAWLQALGGRRADRAARTKAIAEMLTSVADLMQGIRVIRGAYQHKTRWRYYVRLAAAMGSAVGAVLPGNPGSAPGREDWAALLDLRIAGPALARLLQLDSEADESQRALALDLSTVLLPRVTRFYSALSVVTLGSDDQVAAAARSLASDMGALLEKIAAKPHTFARAERAAHRALGEFRRTVDKKLR